MHGYNGLGASTKPAVTLDAFKSEGLTNEKWLQSLEAHYNNPEISHLRGDLRLVENGNPGRIIAANVSPAEGWAATKAWARSKGVSLPGCS